jgi:hypothetical protein
MDKVIINSLNILEKYVRESNFFGFDPYDALNSEKLIKINNKLLRILLTQIFVYSPINFRNYFDVNADRNPKAMGLFLSSYCRLFENNLIEKKDFNEISKRLVEYLIKNKSKGYSGYCWGFNFNWQDKSRFAGKWLPTLVITSYVGNSLLDLYEINKEKKLLEIAVSICSFILKDLNITESENGICFSYTPIDKHIIHNANCLGAAFLSRVYSIIKDEELLDYSAKAMDFSVCCQNIDGSWDYGFDQIKDKKRKQTDFHQGFILDSLIDFIKYSGKKNEKYEKSLWKGLEFYKKQQFEEFGRSLWRLPWKYPVDIHHQAQGIISLSKSYIEFGSKNYLEFARKIAVWTISNMQDKSGFFYFQKWPIVTNKLSYIRWAQAWMLYALTILVMALGKNDQKFMNLIK